MNWLDIVIVVLLITRAFFGWKRGIITAAVSMAGAAIGVLLASAFYKPLAVELGFMPIEDFANILAFILIFISIDVVVTVLGRMLKSIGSVARLGLIDKGGGTIFGFLMGAIEWGALLAILVKYLGTGLVTKSLLAKVLLDNVPLILVLLPGEFDAIRNLLQ